MLGKRLEHVAPEEVPTESFLPEESPENLSCSEASALGLWGLVALPWILMYGVMQTSFEHLWHLLWDLHGGYSMQFQWETLIISVSIHAWSFGGVKTAWGSSVWEWGFTGRIW